MKVSVIIPVLGEEETISSALEDLVNNHDPDEIIVVDGGSNDNSCEIANKHAKLFHSKPGRAVQMNEGAKYSNGEILLFLHADTKLPREAIQRIRETLSCNKINSGRFELNFDVKHPMLQFYAYFTRFHLFSYGDQGLFIKKELFEKLGGFRENVPFEDIDFYGRLLNYEKPVILNTCVTTSARRFLKKGIIKQGIIDVVFFLICLLGLNNRLVLPLKKWLYADIR